MDNQDIDDRGMVNPVQVQKFLEGVDYPASKGDLINNARQKGADQNVISTLEKLPDQTYNTPVDVSETLGKME